MTASNGLVPVSQDAIKAITLYADYSKISENDRVNVALSLCDRYGLDPATTPFNWLKNDKTGVVALYANKSCAAQLASNRKLKCEIVSEGLVLESVYSVRYRVTEGDRVTEDVGVSPITYFKKGEGSTPGSWARLEGGGLSDAIMKAHTKATRRTVLKHCGLGLPDEKEEPLVVIDTSVTAKEEPKPQEPPPKQEETKKLEAPTPQEKPKKAPKEKWSGILTSVQELKLPDGRPAWELMGFDGTAFKTADPPCAEIAQEASDKAVSVDIKFTVNSKGTNVVTGLKAEAL